MKATKEGKPYCTEHVDLMPYVQELIDREVSHEEELERARMGRWRRIDTTGLIAQDVLQLVLTQGQASQGKISRNVTRDRKAARSYMLALKKAGLVKLGKSRRGELIALPPGKKKR